jgi:hypothetical protein
MLFIVSRSAFLLKANRLRAGDLPREMPKNHRAARLG